MPPGAASTGVTRIARTKRTASMFLIFSFSFDSEFQGHPVPETTGQDSPIRTGIRCLQTYHPRSSHIYRDTPRGSVLEPASSDQYTLDRQGCITPGNRLTLHQVPSSGGYRESPCSRASNGIWPYRMIPAVADFSGNSALSDNPDGGLRRPHLLQRVWHLC